MVIWPLSQVGGGLPKINEGDLLYMPSTCLASLRAEAAALLQTTDKLIKAFLKWLCISRTGKAETATGFRAAEMVETTIQLKPEDRGVPA